MVNVVGGVDLVEPKHRRVAHAFGASRWATFRGGIAPAALPGIFAALWYGIKQAFLGVLWTRVETRLGRWREGLDSSSTTVL